MKITKKNLPKSQAELTIELSYEEFKPYLAREAAKLAISGFRQGKAPYEIVKQQIGETKLLNEALPKIFQNTLMEAFAKEKLEVIGQPTVDIEKLDHGVSLTYKATASILPKTELGDYKNIKATKKEIKIEDKEIEKVLEELKERQAKETITDKAVKKGYVATADFNMLFDKVPLEGGQFKNHRIIVGNEIFPKLFNDNIIGMKAGEEKKFDIEYPSDHFDKKLAGKNITFDLKLNQVYERTFPEINDEFAKSLGMYNTLKDLKDHIKITITSDKERREKERFEGELLEKLLNNCKFDELPDILLESEIDKMIKELEANILSQGGKFEDYLTHIKKSKDDLKKDFETQAIKRVKLALAVRKLAEIENVKVEDKDIEEEIENIYKSYEAYGKVMPPDIEENIKSDAYKNYLKNVLVNKKVIEQLAEWAQSDK